MASNFGIAVDKHSGGFGLKLEGDFDATSAYELIYAIKKSFPRTRVVIMTGAGKDTVFSRKSTAVDDVISKPFTLAEIDETIQNLSGKALCG